MPARAPRRVTAILAVVAAATTLFAVAAAVFVIRPLLTQTAANGPVAVAGQGAVKSEDRTAGLFRGVKVGAGIKVVIGTGSEAKVTLAAQANLLPMIHTDVTAGQLVLTVDAPGFTSTDPVTLTVEVPALDSISLGEGATATVEDVGGLLSVDLSGGATILAIGEVASLRLTAAGGSAARLGEVLTESAIVTLTGASRAELHVTGAVTGTADGGSSLVLQAKPASLDVTTSGGATIEGG
jgi:hypothetical protein